MRAANPCPKCGSELVARSGKSGPFWGCPRFPECRGSRSIAPPARSHSPIFQNDDGTYPQDFTDEHDYGNDNYFDFGGGE